MSKVPSTKSVDISPAALAALDEAIRDITPTSGISADLARKRISNLFKKIRLKKPISKTPLQNARLS